MTDPVPGAGAPDEGPGRDDAAAADRMAVINDAVRRRAGQVVLGVDLAATFVFAIEGGLAGVDARLDLFGVMVIALITATGGGMIRDVLMGDTPPRSLRTARYVLLGTGGGLVAFVIHQSISSVPENLMTGLDAVGLSLFAVSGAALALAAGMHPLTAVLLGTITAVGGGTIRDVLLNRVPVILEANIYALAALLGAAVMVWLVRGGRPRSQSMVAGAACCFALRVVSVWQDWNLPVAGL